MTADVQVEKEVGKDEAARDSVREYVVPRADIYQNEKEVVLVADMPGVDGTGVTVSVEDHHLILEGQSTTTAPANHRLIRQEFKMAPYRRVFRLAEDVHEDGIQASVKNGLLKVKIPTFNPAKTKRITVEQA